MRTSCGSEAESPPEYETHLTSSPNPLPVHVTMKTRSGLPMFNLSLPPSPLISNSQRQRDTFMPPGRWSSRAIHESTMIAWTCEAQTPLEMVKKGKGNTNMAEH